MRPERLLPVILVIVGAAAFFSVYNKKTRPIPVPAEVAGQPGPRLFFEHDCATCHTISTLPGARGTLGPGLDDVGHRAETLDPGGGGKQYLRESVTEPGKIVREGFVNAMPSFAEKLSQQELSQLVDWLSTLRAPTNGLEEGPDV
jgi:mono/diheme cytochrome c family protein